MRALTFIIDPATGSLTVEGLGPDSTSVPPADLLPAPHEVNCARPAAVPPLARSARMPGVCEQMLQVACLYHGSVIDGPGRRSVLQVQGCLGRCSGCYVPYTHDQSAGTALPVAVVLAALLSSAGEPRDGVSVTGGEPFLQPAGLLALLRVLRAAGQHTTVYTGYTLAALSVRPEPEVRAALSLIDLLIDGPYVAGLAEGAGEWRGSRNQHLIHHPGSLPSPSNGACPESHPG